MSSLGKLVTVRIGAIAGLICGAVIGISIFLITLAGLKFSPEIFNYDIPTLYMASVAVAAL